MSSKFSRFIKFRVLLVKLVRSTAESGLIGGFRLIRVTLVFTIVGRIGKSIIFLTLADSFHD